MEIKQILTTLAPYNVSFKIIKDCYVVSITFDEKWVVSNPKNKKIHHQVKDGTNWYWGDINKIEFEDIYNEINDVIVKNKEIAMTMALLTAKLEELKKMFSKLPLDKLKRLKFVIEDAEVPTKKRGRKPTKKNTTKKVSVEPIVDSEINVEQPVVPTPIMPVDFIAEDDNDTTAEETMESLMSELG